MIATEAYSELLRALYAAPLDEAQWQVFLTDLCVLTQSSRAIFFRNDSTLGNQMLAAGGDAMPPFAATTYQETHRYSDPFRQAFMRRPRLGIIEGEDLVPDRDLLQTDIYRTMLAPIALRYMTCVVLSISPRTHEVICLWRTAAHPHLAADAQDLLRCLIPHLQNAVNIRQTLGASEKRARNVEAMLDASPTAAILLDAAGHLVHHNEAARALTAAANGLRFEGRRIAPTDPRRRVDFETLLAACGDPAANHPGGAVFVDRPSGARPLQVFISPLRVEGQECNHRRRILLLATDPDRNVLHPDAMLRELYGLSPAETEIANGLLTGFSLEEIATLRRVSVSTVRSQMKNLLGKTETRRQGDLIRLLGTLPHKRQQHPAPSPV